MSAMEVVENNDSRSIRVKAKDARSIDVTLTFEEVCSNYPDGTVSWSPVKVVSNSSIHEEEFSNVNAGYFVFFLRTQIEKAKGSRSKVKLNGQESPMEKCFVQFAKKARFLCDIFGCKEGQLSEYLGRAAGEVWLNPEVELKIEVVGKDGEVKDRSGDVGFLSKLEVCLSSSLTKLQCSMDVIVEGARTLTPVSMRKSGSGRGLIRNDHARLEFSSNESLELAVFWCEHDQVHEVLPKTGEELLKKPHLMYCLDYEGGTSFKIPANGGIEIVVDEKPHLAFVYAKRKGQVFTVTEIDLLNSSLEESANISAESVRKRSRETSFFDLLKLEKFSREGGVLVEPWQEVLLESLPGDVVFAQVAVLEPSEAELSRISLAS